MGNILKIIVLIVVLVGLILPLATPPPVQAEEGLGTNVIEVLEPGEVRIDPYTKVVRVGGSTSSNFLATISSLPATMLDGRTLITTEWLVATGNDGVEYLTTGNNLVTATVTGTRVTAQYEGKQAAWDPTILVGEAVASYKSGPTVIDDPLNEYYKSNTIKWEYSFTAGWFIFTREYTVTRYLRQIEGLLQEYYKLPYNPNADVEIYSGYDCEPGFIWDRPVEAWDSNFRPIPISGDGDTKLVTQEELSKSYLEYPVFIDPTVAFTTSSSDGDIYRTGSSYATTWTSTTGTVHASSTDLGVGQYWFEEAYWIFRSFVFFNTASLPDGAIPDSATLQLYGIIDESDTDFYITIQSGMPTYPRDPLVAGDYNKAYYASDDGGSLHTSGFHREQYNSIALNSDGRSWINKTGYTKFAIRSNREISGIVPTNAEGVLLYSYEWGTGYAPKLEVAYTLPIVKPTINTQSATDIGETSATLRGVLTDDGGATCTVRFYYGTSPNPGVTGIPSPMQEGVTPGQAFSASIAGLLRGTTYYYTAEASNSAGSSDADEESFATRPGAPTSFTVTPGDEENDLAWTKGTGSDKTMVRFSTTGYPDNPTSGTQIYFNTGVSYLHASLENGVTYYYSAWGEEDGSYSTSYATGSGVPFVLGPPVVSTYDATQVEATTATLNGYLVSLNGYGSADVWFQYYWGAGTWTDNETTPEALTEPGQHSEGVTSLPASTLINFRIAATSTGGTTYGSGETFTTGDPSAPEMQTNAASGTTKVGSTLHGEVVDDGGATVTAWFEWGLTTQYGFETATAAGLFSEDSIYATLSDLTPSTTYYFRIIGENSVGTGYGTGLSFTTDAPTSPSVTTLSAIGVSATEATLRGQLVSDGGVPCEVKFDYGLTDGYGSSTGWQAGITSGTVFEAVISDLDIDETYHFRAVARNSASEEEGEDQTFVTEFGPPNDFAAYSLGTDSISLRWERIGDQTGIFMKAGAFPADRLDGIQVYFGNAESVTVGDLDAGTTYFFRAWSWVSGGTWSDTYTEGVATTGAVVTPDTPDVPDVTGEWPDTPDEVYQDPSGAAFATWPFYDIVNDVASKIGMPAGSLWLILAIVAIVVGGGIVFLISGSILVTFIGIAVLLVFAGLMGLVPIWILIAFVVTGGGLAYFTKFS